MSTEKDLGLGGVDLGWLRWRGVWLPTLTIAFILLVEGVFENYPTADWKGHIFSVHFLMIGLTAFGAYLFSYSTFKLVRRGQEEILRKSKEIAAFERRFRALVEHSTDFIALLDADGVVRYASPSFTGALGYNPTETVGRSILDLIVPYDHENVRKMFHESVQKPRSVVFDSCRIYHKEGDWHWIGVCLSNLLTDPDVGAIVWNAHDITNWRQADISLRGLTEGIPIGLYRTTAAGQLLEANPALAQMLGYPNRQDLLAAKAIDFYADPSDRLRWQALMARHGIVRDFEFRARRRDGAIIWLKNTARAVRDEHKGITCYEGAVEDVTERKRAEQALIDKQAQMAGILESAMDAIITLDAKQHIVLFNAAAEAMFCCSAKEAMGQPIERFIPDWRHASQREEFRALDQSGATDQNGWKPDGLTGLRPHGNAFPIDAVLWKSLAGGETFFTLSVRDSTERRRAEDALRKLSRAIDQTAESIFITDRNGVIEYANPAFEAMTGFARSEAIGKRATILRSGVHDKAFYEEFTKTLMSGEVFKAVFTNRRKDGQDYLLEEIVSPIVDAQQTITHFVSTGRDVTERDRAEKEVRRSREQLRALAAHLESVREEEQTRIAREIHDELGQTLTAMKYDLAWLAARLPEAATVLRDKCRELTSLTDATIATVRRIASELRPRLLDDLGLEAAVEWLTKSFESRTGIQCELDARLGEVALDPALSTAVFRILQEALTNVARHAKAASVSIDLHRDEGGVVLSVRDDGKGISQDELAGMTSLGLLGMRERARGCGGDIAISGTAGAGTTVVARFPLVHRGLVQP